MIPIFMYHQVAEMPRKLDPLGLAIPPVQFEQQMSYLARNGFSCLTLAEAAQYFRNGTRAPARSFVLTFDDGYQDVYTVARPILEKFGFTATVFLVVGQMGLVSHWWGQEGARSGQILSQVEARDLARQGFILGSHTLSHPFLTSLDDQSALDEIKRSRAMLQDILETQVDYFSYPYSDTDARCERLVASAGYKAACAGDMGPQSIFHLWRVPCQKDDSPLAFAMKAGGWYDQRTALRESPAGCVLRNNFRKVRRLFIRHPSIHEVLKQDLEAESQGNHD